MITGGWGSASVGSKPSLKRFYGAVCGGVGKEGSKQKGLIGVLFCFSGEGKIEGFI